MKDYGIGVRSYTDLYTKKLLSFNDTCVYCGVVVPMASSTTRAVQTHPHRVPEWLLRELNEGTEYEEEMVRELERRKEV